MSAAIIATVGAVDANSFGTVAEADTYHDTVLHPDAIWADLGNLVKIPALIMAQQQMTALIAWTGFPTTTSQKLPWARNGMYDRSGYTVILDSVIPDEVKWCQFELARLLAYADRTAEFDIGVNGIVRLQAGPVRVTFRDAYNMGPAILAPVAYNLLVPSWFTGISGVQSMTRDLERG